MSPRLKFRVWCHRTKHFSDAPFLSSDGKQLLWLHTGNQISFSNLDKRLDLEPEYTLQWSCGVFDKNAKEIYEGDFIRYTPYNQKDYKNTIVKVPLISYFHWFGELEEMFIMENSCDIEVIGNVFQNPEYAS